MKRSATEVLRRGFDSTLANWPLILIRIAEGIVFVGIIIVSIVAAIVPIAVSAGISKYDVTNAANPAAAAAELVLQHWMLIVYVLVIVTAVLLVLMAIHSFVEAGTAQVFVDAERRAKGVTAPLRPVFRAFTIDRWMAGGRAGWWSVFWIYNATWSVAALIMLVPLLVTAAAMIVISDSTVKIIAGCGGLVLSVVILLPVAVVVAIWTQKAITVCIARAAGTTDALRVAWREMRDDFGRHFAVAFVLFMVSMGGAMVISMITFPMSFTAQHRDPFMSLAFAPMQIVVSFAQTIFSAGIGAWFLASFVTLTEDR
ncbi:MAG TPA: hypothetical protein VIO12_07670 [Thermoanaerobaculia bacterium]